MAFQAVALRENPGYGQLVVELCPTWSDGACRCPRAADGDLVVGHPLHHVAATPPATRPVVERVRDPATGRTTRRVVFAPAMTDAEWRAHVAAYAVELATAGAAG